MICSFSTLILFIFIEVIHLGALLYLVTLLGIFQSFLLL